VSRAASRPATRAPIARRTDTFRVDLICWGSEGHDSRWDAEAPLRDALAVGWSVGSPGHAAGGEDEEGEERQDALEVEEHGGLLAGRMARRATEA